MWEWMGTIMLIFAGVATLAVTMIAIQKEKDKKISSNETTAIIVFTMITLTLAALGSIISMENNAAGRPKTSIETGDYSIVSYAETMSGDESMYQMILKQNNKIEFYALPKSMVTIDKSNEIPGTLEVIEKAGSKKAILYFPANQINPH